MYEAALWLCLHKINPFCGTQYKILFHWRFWFKCAEVDVDGCCDLFGILSARPQPGFERTKPLQHDIRIYSLAANPQYHTSAAFIIQLIHQIDLPVEYHRIHGFICEGLCTTAIG